VEFLTRFLETTRDQFGAIGVPFDTPAVFDGFVYLYLARGSPQRDSPDLRIECFFSSKIGDASFVFFSAGKGGKTAASLCGAGYEYLIRVLPFPLNRVFFLFVSGFLSRGGSLSFECFVPVSQVGPFGDLAHFPAV